MKKQGTGKVQHSKRERGEKAKGRGTRRIKKVGGNSMSAKTFIGGSGVKP